MLRVQNVRFFEATVTERVFDAFANSVAVLHEGCAKVGLGKKAYESLLFS